MAQTLDSGRKQLFLSCFGPESRVQTIQSPHAGLPAHPGARAHAGYPPCIARAAWERLVPPRGRTQGQICQLGPFRPPSPTHLGGPWWGVWWPRIGADQGATRQPYAQRTRGHPPVAWRALEVRQGCGAHLAPRSIRLKVTLGLLRRV